MDPRSIIHINIADFAVAVERTLDPRLQGRPLIIAPTGTNRAVVYDMSEEAYQSGVCKGMALGQALRRCRNARVVPPHADRYSRAMTRLIKQALPYSPRIEITDHNGHLFVDATGTGRLFGPPPDIAWRIRRHVKADMGFDPIWSVAPNKLVAKVATRIVKPAGEYIVEAGEETSVLAPVPLHWIPGIEVDDFKRLRELNLVSAKQVSRLSPDQLEIIFGSRSQQLYELVRGIDTSPVSPIGQQPPISTVSHLFDTDTNDVTVARHTAYRLIERIGSDLRQKRLTARRVTVVVDYADGGRQGGQAVVFPATAHDTHLFASAKAALHRAWTRRVRIRHLRITCDRLVFPSSVQLALFAEDQKRSAARQNLSAAVDAVRRRFGDDAVGWAGYACNYKR